MKVVALKSLYSKYRWAASPGDVVDVDSDIAEEMIKNGDAEPLAEKPKAAPVTTQTQEAK